MNTIKWIVAVTVLAFSSVAFADSPKIGFIYIGPPGDHGWTYMHDQGRQDIEIELGFETNVEVNFNDNAKKALSFNRNLLMENFIIPNKLKFPLFRNILESYFL